MIVELFHTQTCHIWPTALKELEAALLEAGVDAEIKTVVVDSQEQAEKCRFLGSPTLHVDGRDVDPVAEKLTKYGLAACRTYWFSGKSFEFPPKEMILAALKANA